MVALQDGGWLMLVVVWLADVKAWAWVAVVLFAAHPAFQVAAIKRTVDHPWIVAHSLTYFQS